MLERKGRQTLHPRMIAALKPAPRGTRYDVADAIVPGFAVRVTDTGVKSYILIKRLPGASNPTRRSFGRVGTIELAKARAKAREWLEQIEAGTDPKAVEAAKREAAAIEQAKADRDSFDAIAEEYIAQRLDGKKKIEIARALRREFGGRIDGLPVGPWAGKHIRDIEPEHVADVILAKAETAPTQARNCLSHLGRLMRWAVSRGKIKYSPAAQIRPGDLLGKVSQRSRLLTDDELRRVWNAALAEPYPWGPIYRMLIMTGCRLNEVADARWSEFDFRGGAWKIPASRMKGKRVHVVPLLPLMLDLLQTLPRGNAGDHLFSNSNGEASVTVSDYIKGRMDLAARVYDWRNHDLRRTMRSHLSALPIEEHVRELMIAHKRQGIQGTYDHAQYFDEKRAGFELWHSKLSRIIDPVANVVPLQRTG